MSRDYYEILGVGKSATNDELKIAYRKMAKQHHPDMNQDDPEAEQRFKEVRQAYETLSDGRKRAMYDTQGPTMHFRTRGGKPGVNPFGGGFENMWEEFFGGSNFRGRNIQVRIEISLDEVAKGCKKLVKIRKRLQCRPCQGNGYTDSKPCVPCNGTGFQRAMDAPFQMQIQCQVCGGSGKESVVKCEDCAGSGFTRMQNKSLKIDIPPGIENGMQIRLRGEGEEAKKRRSKRRHSGFCPGERTSCFSERSEQFNSQCTSCLLPIGSWRRNRDSHIRRFQN